MLYTSKQNPLIKEIASLKDKKYRALKSMYIAEGIKPVNEAIVCGADIKYIVVTQTAKELITPCDFNFIEVSDAVFNYLSEEVTPQGALAVISIPSLDVLPPSGNCLVLDGVRDPGNLGAIIRSANAFGYKDIYLIDCADPYSPKTVRASMSGVFFVKLYKGDCKSVVNALDGYKLLVADMGNEDLDGFVPPKKFAIVVGNEGSGVSAFMLNHADKVLSIKMQESAESLNVAVAASIFMYELKK